MNKLIDKLFEKKIVIRLVSVLTAMLLWFIVLDLNNPMLTRTITVPVVSNVEVLEDRNLRIIGMGAPASVDLVVRGRRAYVSEVTPNDFSVTIDFEQVQASGAVAIDISEPIYDGEGNIRIMSMSPSRVQLRLERITGVEFPVQVRWDGNIPSGFQAVNVQIEPTTVRFEDKESLVNRIEAVVVPLDATSLERTSNLTRRVLVLDSDGNAISQFDGGNTVNVSFDLIRTLPVIAQTSGTPAHDWFMTGFKLTPPEVQVRGAFSDLQGLSGVSSASIDLYGREGSFVTDLVLEVPEGFSLYGIKPQVSVEVEMEKLETRNISFPTGLIEIEGLDPAVRSLQFVAEDFALVIKGKKAALDVFTAGAISVTLDAAVLPSGESFAAVRVILPPELTLMEEPIVQLILSDITADEPGQGNQDVPSAPVIPALPDLPDFPSVPGVPSEQSTNLRISPLRAGSR